MNTPPSPKTPSWRQYLPLLVILLLTSLSAAAISWSNGSPSLHSWMRIFMGLFLVVFAMLKLFDLPSFATGFQKYDLLAKPCRPYALLYPFIELTLGLAFLANFHPQITYIATIIVTTFGAIGILIALRKGLDINCACLGSNLNVPLSTVALIENLGMAAMTLVMLLKIA